MTSWFFRPPRPRKRINVFYRHRQEAALAGRPARRRPPNIPGVDVPVLQLPPELADTDIIGVETDVLNFYNPQDGEGGPADAGHQ